MSEWELIEDPQEITAEYFPNEGGIMWEGKAYLPADYVLHADREPSDAEVLAAKAVLDSVEYADEPQAIRAALIAAQEVRDES